MTALCPGGGPSGPRPAIDSGIAFSASAIELAIKKVLGRDPGAWLSVLASTIALTTDVYCSSDPPADPHLTQTDWDNALSPPNPAAYAQALLRVKDWFLNWYWWQVCECTGAVTPPPPTPSQPPSIGSDTNVPVGGTGQTCWDQSGSQAMAEPNFTTLLVQSYDVGAMLFASNWLSTVTDGAPYQQTALNSNFPAPVQWRVTATLDSAIVNGFVEVLQAESAHNGTSGSLALLTWNGTAGEPLTKSVTFLQTTQALVAPWTLAVQNGDHAAHTLQLELQLWCTNPNAPVTDCCPPDPLVEFYLQQILTLVQNLYTSPAAAPSTGWADATAHAGLSGTGSFQLGTNVTGIRANFTTIPSNIRVTAGTPTFYWDLGFVTPVALVTPLRSLRTVFASQAMPLPVQTTAIDYTFPPGAVVTLTELVPA